jgi:hypothetical protein
VVEVLGKRHGIAVGKISQRREIECMVRACSCRGRNEDEWYDWARLADSVEKGKGSVSWVVNYVCDTGQASTRGRKGVTLSDDNKLRCMRESGGGVVPRMYVSGAWPVKG